MKKVLFELTELELEYLEYLVDTNIGGGLYCIRLQSLLDKINQIPSDNYIQLVDDSSLFSGKSSIFSTEISYPDNCDNVKLLRLGNGKLSTIKFVIYSLYILVDKNFCDWALSLSKEYNQKTELNCDNDSGGNPDDIPFGHNIISLIINTQHWLKHNLEIMSNVEKSNSFKKLTTTDKNLYYELIKTLECNFKNITMLLNNE